MLYLHKDLIQPDEDGYYTVTLLPFDSISSRKFTPDSIKEAVGAFQKRLEKGEVYSELIENGYVKHFGDLSFKNYYNRSLEINELCSCGSIKSIELVEENGKLGISGKFKSTNDIVTDLLSTNRAVFGMRGLQTGWVDSGDPEWEHPSERNSLNEIVTFDLLLRDSTEEK